MKSLLLSVVFPLTALGSSLATRLTNKFNAEENTILILPVYFLLIIYILQEVFAAPHRIINAQTLRFPVDEGL